MSRPMPELETEVRPEASLDVAPARPTVEQVVENIVRDAAEGVRYVVDTLVPFGGE